MLLFFIGGQNIVILNDIHAFYLGKSIFTPAISHINRCFRVQLLKDE
jgi:hypothetical protein